MNGVHPGDRVLYLDGIGFFVGRVQTVRESRVTVFPFDPARRDWSSKNRRVPISAVVGKLSPREHADRIAARINILANQREALRQRANRQFQESVRQLVSSETPSL